jgi:hypothetical protein
MIDLKFRRLLLQPELLSFAQKKDTFALTIFFCNKHVGRKMCCARRCLNGRETKNKSRETAFTFLSLIGC